MTAQKGGAVGADNPALLAESLITSSVLSTFPQDVRMAPCEGLSLGTPHVLLDTACAKYALSKTLGYGIVVGSAGVKLPQVFAILKSGGVSGLSSASILIEMASLVSSFSYYMALGYPFSTWGEKCVLA